MSAFAFRFEALLKYRHYRRDLLRSLFAQVLAQKDAIERQRAAVLQQREHQLSEIRELTGEGTIDIDAAASRRFHAGNLKVDRLQIERQIRLIEEQLEACRRAVITAEQDVEALERLKSKQRGEHEFAQQKRQQNEMEDVWLSAHAGEFAV